MDHLFLCGVNLELKHRRLGSPENHLTLLGLLHRYLLPSEHKQRWRGVLLLVR